MNILINLWQQFIYGVLKQRPSIDFSAIPSEISFRSHYDSKNDVHWVETAELPEFYVSGKTSEELAKNVGDTLLVYYDIPTYFSRKWKDGTFQFTNQKTGEFENIIVNKEEFNRVLA